MLISPTMDLAQLAECMGDVATQADARAMRAMLVNQYADSDVTDTDEISEQDWENLLTDAAARSITRANIRALRDAAGEAGDLAMVAICERALDGDHKAWTKCERVIRDARAQVSP